jgi:RHS repeat-associated protein
LAVNGAAPVITTYNLANEITNAGYTYDAAGNLTNDGTAAATYDALHRTTARGGTTYAYNGDGVLVSQLTAGVTTRYTQDLAAPLSQILSDGSTAYLYGLDRLAAQSGGANTWYVADALGSVRRTVSEAGVPQGVISYDPWGTVESGTVPTFGFTGELQPGGDVYLRARWYHAGSGRFGSRDPFAGAAETPYSLHPYQYAYSAPTVWTDPSGKNPYPDPVGRVSRLEGIYIGAVLALAFLAGNPGVRYAEYPVPGASNGRGRNSLNIDGFADLVDFAAGEVYEVKTQRTYQRSRSTVLTQLDGYIRGLNRAAGRAPTDPYFRPPPATGIWKRGSTYLAGGTYTFGLWPFGIDPSYQPEVSGYYVIKAKLAESGVIIYWGELVSAQKARAWVPEYNPRRVVGFIDDTYTGQKRRKPDFGQMPPRLYPGMNIYDPGYWCAVFADMVQYYGGQLGQVGEQLNPTSPGGVPGIPGGGSIPVAP